MSNITGEALFRAVTSSDVEYSSQLILEFKAHIKRDLVNLSYVPRYFESLIIAYKNPALSINSFSTICHLVKRISIQDPSVLKLVDFQVIPFLIDRLSDDKLSLKNTAKKAMVNYWQAVPNEFEITLKTYGLRHVDSKVRCEILCMLCEIVENTPGFSFKTFLPDTVLLTDDHELDVANIAAKLLVLVFRVVNPNNRTARHDLVVEFVGSKVSRKTATRVLMQVDDELVHEYNRLQSQSSFVSAGSIKVTTSAAPTTNTATSRQSLERPKSRLSYAHHHVAQQTKQPRPATSQQRISSGGLRQTTPSASQTELRNTSDSSNTDLSKYLSEVPLYFYDDDNIQPFDVNSEDQLLDKVESMSAPFDGKETEFNWSSRERIIIQLRRIVRGNAATEYPNPMAQLVKLLKDCICKAVSSLRTTLSSNGCQLCKELGIYLGPYLDNSTVESLIVHLIKLTSARKSISHQNANAGVVGLLNHTHFNARVVNQIALAAQDKNAQPRAYSGSWFHLLLLKYNNNRSVFDNTPILETFEKIILKGVSDPSPAVRDSMRSCFWCLNEVYPAISERIMSKLDANALRALEKVRPQKGSSPGFSGSSAGGSSAKPNNRLSHRPSMKELIMAKQRETQSQNQLQSQSQPSRRMGSDPKSRQIKPASRSTSDLAGRRNTSATASRSASQDFKTSVKPPPNEKENDEELEKKEDYTGTFTLSLPVDKLRRHTGEQDDDYLERGRRQRHLYEYLSSDDKIAQQKGFDLLISMHQEERLSSRFNSLLNRLSIVNPRLFSPMFESESLLLFLTTYLESDNVIRLACIYDVNFGLSKSVISKIFGFLSLDDLCLAVIHTLNLTVDASKCDDINLSMQFIKYKLQFMKTCFSIIEFIFETETIQLDAKTADSMLKIIFNCWEIVHIEPDQYINLMKLGYQNYKESFTQCFTASEDKIMKKELGKRLELSAELQKTEFPQSSPPPNEEAPELDDALVDGLTMIVGNKFETVNRDVNSDMTMIMPSFKKRAQHGTFLQMDQVRKIEEGQEDDIYDKEDKGLNMGYKNDFSDNPFVEKSKPSTFMDDLKGEFEIEEVFKDKHTDVEQGEPETREIDQMDIDSAPLKNDDAQIDLDHHSDRSVHVMSDTTPDLNQLTLSEHSKLMNNSSDHISAQPPRVHSLLDNVQDSASATATRSSKDIDSIIESTDPLSVLTGSSGKIEIYEDIQRPLEELDSWFEFETYKYSRISSNNAEPKHLLAKLRDGTIVNNELLQLIHVIDQDEVLELRDVQASLLKFLNVGLSIGYIFVGLALLRVCVLRNDGFDIEAIFHKLVELSSLILPEDETRRNGEDDDELIIAISESFGLIRNFDLYVERLQHLKTLSVGAQQMLLENIVKLMSPENLTPENIFKLDLVLYRLLSSKVTAVRRLSVLCYATLLKYKNLELKDKQNVELIDDLIFEKLNPSQLQLVQHYVNKV